MSPISGAQTPIVLGGRSSLFIQPVAFGVVPYADTDGDLVGDDLDNCLLVINPDQRDTNMDGYGNVCDYDYDNNGTVKAPDFVELALAFGARLTEASYREDLDVDANGEIGSLEFVGLSLGFNSPPGPSGLACAGTIPCGP